MVCVITLCCPAQLLFGLLIGSSAVTGEDVGAWPYSVGLRVKCVAFLGTLHWPAAGADLGFGGGLPCGNASVV